MLRKTIIEYEHENKVQSVEFDKRLRKIVDEYNSRDNLKFTSDVVADFVNELSDKLIEIMKDLDKGRNHPFEGKVFFDILVKVRNEHNFDYADEKCLILAKEIKALVDDKSKFTNFMNRTDIKNQLEMNLKILLYKNGYPPEWNKEIFGKLLEQFS